MDYTLCTLHFKVLKHPKFGTRFLLTTNGSWLFLTHKEEAIQILKSLVRSYRNLSDEDIEELTKLNVFRMEPSIYFQDYKEFPKYATQEDIDKFLDRYLKTFPTEKSRTAGHVYFLKCGEYTKIGKTTNLDKRIEGLSTIIPEEVKLLHVIKSNDYSKCEKYFHDKYKNKRKKGEWFILSVSDIKEIKQIREKNF